jgi:phosphatidylinositol glycan class N
VSLLLPLKSPRGMLARLLSIFLGFAPLFLLLSIGYGHPILHVWFRVKFVLFSLLQTTSVSLHETFMQ